MSRYIEIAHRPFQGPIASAVLSSVSLYDPADQDNRPQVSVVPRVNGQGLLTFVVKLRNTTTRMWGDQIEVRAVSATDAAEEAAGEHLVEGRGERADLRVSVWQTPFGSRPCRLFYLPELT